MLYCKCKTLPKIPDCKAVKIRLNENKEIKTDLLKSNMIEKKYVSLTLHVKPLLNTTNKEIFKPRLRLIYKLLTKQSGEENHRMRG